MARARNIKPGFFKNEVLAEAPFEARLLFIGLWTLADREGRLEDRPRRIQAELFPFDGFDVGSMLSRLQDGGFLFRYEVDGKSFIQIENFVKHQDPHYKEKASEIPAPPGRENLVLASGVTRTQRARVLERDGYVCLGCGAAEHLCIDHILPVSRGGDSSDDNLQTLCLSCNTKKGNKLDGEKKNSYLRRDQPDFDSKLAQVRGASPSEPLSSDSPSSDSLIADTRPALVCKGLKQAGMQSVNPSDPRLLALLAAGLSPEEIIAAGAEAVEKKKPFAYALAIAEGRRRDAATAPLPDKRSATTPAAADAGAALEKIKRESEQAAAPSLETLAKMAELRKPKELPKEVH